MISQNACSVSSQLRPGCMKEKRISIGSCSSWASWPQRLNAGTGGLGCSLPAERHSALITPAAQAAGQTRQRMAPSILLRLTPGNCEKDALWLVKLNTGPHHACNKQKCSQKGSLFAINLSPKHRSSALSQLKCSESRQTPTR